MKYLINSLLFGSAAVALVSCGEKMRNFARESELSFRAGFLEAEEAVQTVDYFKVDDINTVETGETYHKATLDGVDMDSYSDL